MRLAELLQEFAEIWAVDFEFIAQTGEIPDVVCLVAREIGSGRTLRLWRDQLGTAPPYRIDDNTLFIAFAANCRNDVPP